MLIVRQKDLIGIVSLSRIYAINEKISQGEACEIVTSAIVHGGELIEVYRANGETLPHCIGELNSSVEHKHVIEALMMPLRLQWWRYPACLNDIQPGWGATPDTVAIRRTDAEELLGIVLPDHGAPANALGVTNGLNASEDKRLHPKERNSLLKIVISMAIQGYAYDPKASKSSVTSEIVSDAEKLGIHIDPETVVKFLRAAVEEVLPVKLTDSKG